MNLTGTQRIETERLVLRRFRPEDAEDMYRNWATDPEVTRFLTWPPHADIGVTRTLLADWIEKYEDGSWFNWAIEWKESREVIGNISVVRMNEACESASIGYCLGRAFWGRGIMPEALRAVIRYLQDTVGMNRVAALHDVKNPKSGRVMQKAGMTFEGIMRKAGKSNAGIADLAVYSVIRSDRRPRIAVASYVIGNEGPASPAPTYQNAVLAAGGLAFLVGEVRTEEEADQIYQMFDGLILSGGADINAGFLNEPAHEKCMCATRTRDVTEFLLARRFMQGDKPILAICRGAQLLNVAMGGTHDQHIFDRPEVTIAHQAWETRHAVRVTGGTYLSALFDGAETLQVNSTHHQAVRELADGFVLNAMSPDGVIEGYEQGDRVLATQWHPERMLEEGMLPIFTWLVERSRR